MTAQITKTAKGGMHTSLETSPAQRAARKRLPLLTSTALISVAGAMSMVPSAAFAQDATWDGETGTDWATGTNWNTNTVPGVTNTATINGDGGTNQPIVITNQTVAQTNITGVSLTIDATLTSNVAVSGSGILRINAARQIIGSVQIGGTNTSSNAGTITGSLIVNSGTFDNAGVVTGPTSVNGGILNLNAGSNLADGQLLSVTGGTVNVNVNEMVGGLSGTGGAINVADGVQLTANQVGNSTFSGSFSGTGALNNVYFQKSGAGTLTLAGNNTGTGARRMLVTGGVLQLASGNAVGDQNILEASNSGTIRLLDNETIGALLGNIGGTIDINGRTLRA